MAFTGVPARAPTVPFIVWEADWTPDVAARVPWHCLTSIVRFCGVRQLSVAVVNVEFHSTRVTLACQCLLSAFVAFATPLPRFDGSQGTEVRRCRQPAIVVRLLADPTSDCQP